MMKNDAKNHAQAFLVRTDKLYQENHLDTATQNNAADSVETACCNPSDKQRAIDAGAECCGSELAPERAVETGDASAGCCDTTGSDSSCC